MSKEKKYWWMKMQKDWAKSKKIKKLRRVAGGDTFALIYLEMMLHSIPNFGVLIFEKTEKNLAEQLSIELDEDQENVSIVLNFLFANNLIEEINEDKFLLLEVPNMVGSTSASTERMRRLRARQKLLKEQNVEDKSVTCDDPVTPCYVELELDLELELEKDKEIKNKSILSGKIDEIMAMTNSMLNKNYNPKTKSHRNLISARLNEGYSVEDFKKVLEKKIKQWKNTEQEQYLRPQTLFAQSHFDTYLNDPDCTSKVKSGVSSKESFSQKIGEVDLC